MKKLLWVVSIMTLLLSTQLIGAKDKNQYGISVGIGQLNLEYKLNALMSAELLASYPLNATSTINSTTIKTSFYSYGARVNLFSSDPLNSDWWLTARLYISAFYRQTQYSITSPDTTSKYLNQTGLIFGIRALALKRVYIDLGAGIGSATGSYFDYIEAQGGDLSALAYKIFYSIPIDIRVGFAF